ncbi:hypothetical protein HRR76_009060 [Exophiala dermatitidis]|nr:hypothetical protein HRR76_009060 [Exophiala dermatitidis]
MASNKPASAAAAEGPTSTAAERLSQVAGHVAGSQDESGNTGRKGRRSKTSKAAGPPADYSDVLGNLQKLRTIAHTPDLNNRGYIRQKRDGKLWVRERFDQLLDEDSFKEIGSATGFVEWKQTGPRDEEPVSFTPTNNLQGGWRS